MCTQYLIINLTLNIWVYPSILESIIFLFSHFKKSILKTFSSGSAPFSKIKKAQQKMTWSLIILKCEIYTYIDQSISLDPFLPVPTFYPSYSQSEIFRHGHFIPPDVILRFLDTVIYSLRSKGFETIPLRQHSVLSFPCDTSFHILHCLCSFYFKLIPSNHFFSVILLLNVFYLRS